MTRSLATDAAAIAMAADLLRRGELVAFPTETVYGLGADAGSDEAVAKIYAAKQRPSFNPVIVHVADIEQAHDYAMLDGRARDLAAAFWPGPLTLALPRRDGARLSPLVSAGLPSVTIRIPAHDAALQLIRQAGVPVAAPSANKSGRISPTTPKHVAEQFGDEVSLILAAGRCAVGVESTVIDLCEPEATLLRAGGITREEIEHVIGRIRQGHSERAPRSPGMLARHYAPQTRLRMAALDAAPDEGYLAFGPDSFAGRNAGLRLNLSENGNLAEAAANLFAMLHQMDSAGLSGIAVAPVPETGLGLAINDRLRRASTP